MVIHWPKGIKEEGGLRSQFGHVIDIAEWRRLYNVREDFSLADNVADLNPEKLKELQALFDRDAERFNVY